MKGHEMLHHTQCEPSQLQEETVHMSLLLQTE